MHRKALQKSMGTNCGYVRAMNWTFWSKALGGKNGLLSMLFAFLGLVFPKSGHSCHWLQRIRLLQLAESELLLTSFNGKIIKKILCNIECKDRRKKKRRHTYVTKWHKDLGMEIPVETWQQLWWKDHVSHVLYIWKEIVLKLFFTGA